MRKEYTVIFGILVAMVSGLWLQFPLHDLLGQFSLSHPQNELAARIVSRGVVFILLIWIVQRLGLLAYSGLNNPFRIKEKELLYIPALLIVLCISLNWTLYSNANAFVLILFLFSVLLIGFVEEFCLRGIVLPLIIRSQIRNKKRYAFYIGVVVSALLYLVTHSVELLTQPYNGWEIAVESLFGVSVGVFMGAYMLRIRNLWIVSLLHGSVHFIFRNKILQNESAGELARQSAEEFNPDLLAVIVILLFFVLLIMLGLKMIQKADHSAITSDLQNVEV